LVALVALVMLALGNGAPARAGLVIQVDSATAPAGGSGTFDVVLGDTSGTFQIGGFSIELTVPGASGVTFTAADTNTSPEVYVFGTYQSSPLPFATGPFPNTDFVAGDADLTPPGFVTLNSGDLVGLAHVSFSVANGTPPGPVTVSLVSSGGNTSLSDGDGNPVAFTTQNGTITINSVPEPSTLVLGALGTMLCMGYSHRRRFVRWKARSKVPAAETEE
jgi:hypothetical protein